MQPISRPYRPQVEALEERNLMAAALKAELLGNVLHIEGTDRADTINVRQISGRLSVDGVTIRNGAVSQASVAASAIASINIDALGGDDRISLNSESVPGQQPITTSAWIKGGDGNDTINGGAGDDWLYGGNGNDTIHGGAGNDHIYGEAGNNVLYGDAGNDIVCGGAGTDTIYGGDGNDQLYGEDGNDTLDGGVGLDLMNGGAGFDSYRADFNASQPFVNGTAASDIVQQSSPTCATLSALAEMAQRGYNLPALVTYVGNGLYDVRLFKAGAWYNERVAFNGSWNDTDPAPAHDAAGNNLPEFWTILFQRARLQMYGVNYHSGELSGAQWDAYNNASMGSLLDAGEALHDFTGKLATYYYANQVSATTIANAFQAGKLVLLCTTGSSSANTTLDATTGVVAYHTYALVDMKLVNGQWQLKLYNPWAKDGNGAPRDGNDDGYLTVSWNDVTRLFKSVRVA